MSESDWEVISVPSDTVEFPAGPEQVEQVQDNDTNNTYIEPAQQPNRGASSSERTTTRKPVYFHEHPAYCQQELPESRCERFSIFAVYDLTDLKLTGLHFSHHQGAYENLSFFASNSRGGLWIRRIQASTRSQCIELFRQEPGFESYKFTPQHHFRWL